MHRNDLLDSAKQIVNVDRAAVHGEAENNFKRIADHWTWWLQDKLRPDVSLSAYDVAEMMIGFKQARAMTNPNHVDSHIDKIGYAALAGELAMKDE